MVGKHCSPCNTKFSKTAGTNFSKIIIPFPPKMIFSIRKFINVI